MEELLKEVALSERRKQQIDSFIQMVTKLLDSVPDSPVAEVCEYIYYHTKIHVWAQRFKSVTTVV